MLLTFYLAMVIVLPLALGACVVLKGLPRTRHCPYCAGETIRLRSRPLALVSRWRADDELQARWCTGCGWRGTAAIRRPLSTWPSTVGPDGDAEHRDVNAPGIEIRHLILNGDPWRVRLQCWSEGGRWHGRLLFVSPGGRAVQENGPPLTGSSPVHVLSQVLSLTERALAGRIRRATR